MGVTLRARADLKQRYACMNICIYVYVHVYMYNTNIYIYEYVCVCLNAI